MKWIKILAWITVTTAMLQGCATPPPSNIYTLKLDSKPAAKIMLKSTSLTRAMPLGTTPIEKTELIVPNSILDKEMREGKIDESTTLHIQQLQQIELNASAVEAPHLYRKKTVPAPPWTHIIDLGLPADIQPSEKIGVDLTIRNANGEKAKNYTLQILDEELSLNQEYRKDMEEGLYVFRLRNPNGRYFSGMLELENSEDEFVRFAYVPVFEKINPSELEEIANRKREPRMYITSVEQRNTKLATVYLGSRLSTDNIKLGDDQIQNIEVEFECENNRQSILTLDGHVVGSRFYVDEEKEHYLKIEIPLKTGDLCIYGVLNVPQIERKDTLLTSFAIRLTDKDVKQIIRGHQVIKKRGVYEAPEDPNKEIVMYELILGHRKPRGMEAVEEKAIDETMPEEKAKAKEDVEQVFRK